MSKLLKSVLEKVSENNNEYRNNLRSLNSIIDERTATLVGELVTSSSYSLDFSKTLSEAKDNLVNPISRIVESYVIKDLRSVETVNEQFIEKINDKIETQNITNEEEKNKFNSSLNTLLNEKYLEIVKIKRVNFFNENNQNDEIEEKINDYVLSLKQTSVFNNDLDTIINKYKNDIYSNIKESLDAISNLYQNNFINEVSSNLNTAVEVTETVINEPKEEVNEFKPFIPDAVNIPDVPVMPEVPEFPEPDVVENIPVKETKEEAIIEEPISNKNTIEEPIIDNNVDDKEENISKDPVVQENSVDEVKEMDYTPVKPIEVEEPINNENNIENNKHSYNVDEILKIAKSPILDMPSVSAKEDKKEDSYVNVQKIDTNKEETNIDSEFNEEDIVHEMINRLNNRLSIISGRKKAYEENKLKLEEDERFVNDLIESSISKKEQLDRFEKELNDKEEELNIKQKDLEKKINDIMPFANKVLEEES